MIPDDASDTPRSTASADPDRTKIRADLLQRLPADVLENYAGVKLIIASADIEPITTFLLRRDAASDPMARLFREGSYGRILDAIDTEEKHVRRLFLSGDDTRRQALSRLDGLMFSVYQSLLTEPALAAQGRLFKVLLCATDLDPDADGSPRPRYINPPLRIEVWTRPKGKRQEPRLLDERVLPPGEDLPKRFSLAVVDLLKAHCRIEELRRLRFRRRWWTGRSPEGWPVVTQRLVPRLYDFLRRWYPTRPYAGSGSNPEPGALNRRVMRDIADILRMERPDLCAKLTLPRVRAAVSRYIRVADPERPIGEAMFVVGPSYRVPEPPPANVTISRKKRG